MFGQGEWEFFNGNTTATAQSSIQLPNWASKDRAEIFGMFCNSFGNLIHALSIENANLWRDFADSDTPEVAFPQQVMQNLTPFQRLILIKVLRPDRLESAMNQFVKESFGGQVIQPT